MKLLYQPVTVPEIRVHLRGTLMAMALVFMVSALALAVVFFFHFGHGVSFGHLTRDPTAVMEAPFYTGFLSQFGIIFWSATASICLFSGVVASPLLSAEKKFLYASGLFILLLAIDDLFLLHEGLFPQHLGIPEMVVYAAYAVITLVYVWRFLPIILKTNYLLFGLAFFFFGLSIGIDLFDPVAGDVGYLIEDTPKFMGILTWLAYFSLVSINIVGGKANSRFV
jgi:hypothetical protein